MKHRIRSMIAMLLVMVMCLPLLPVDLFTLTVKAYIAPNRTSPSTYTIQEAYDFIKSKNPSITFIDLDDAVQNADESGFLPSLAAAYKDGIMIGIPTGNGNERKLALSSNIPSAEAYSYLLQYHGVSASEAATLSGNSSSVESKLISLGANPKLSDSNYTPFSQTAGSSRATDIAQIYSSIRTGSKTFNQMDAIWLQNELDPNKPYKNNKIITLATKVFKDEAALVSRVNSTNRYVNMALCTTTPGLIKSPFTMQLDRATTRGEYIELLYSDWKLPDEQIVNLGYMSVFTVQSAIRAGVNVDVATAGPGILNYMTYSGSIGATATAQDTSVGAGRTRTSWETIVEIGDGVLSGKGTNSATTSQATNIAKDSGLLIRTKIDEWGFNARGESVLKLGDDGAAAMQNFNVGYLNLVNEAPSITAKYTTKFNGKDLPDGWYYKYTPIRLTASFIDPEKDIYYKEFKLYRDDALVLVYQYSADGWGTGTPSENFIYADNIIDVLWRTPNTADMEIIPKLDGRYTYTAYVVDAASDLLMHKESGLSKDFGISGAFFVRPSEPVPPVAVISADMYACEGEAFDVKQASYDVNGIDHIISYEWTPPVGISWNLKPNGVSGINGGTLMFPKGTAGNTYTITLKVTNMAGLTDTVTHTIKVLTGVPTGTVEVTEGGYEAGNGSIKLKENRSIVLSAAKSSSSDKYPILWNEVVWTITSNDGQNQYIHEDSANRNGNKQRALQFSKPGVYTVKVQLTNAYLKANPSTENTAASTSTFTINVVEDLAPQGELKVFSEMLDVSTNKVRFVADGYSVDGDKIITPSAYKWNIYQYTNGAWVLIPEFNRVYTSDYREVAITVNQPVGMYLKLKAEVTITETFSEKTISQFLNLNGTNSKREVKFTEEYSSKRAPSIEILPGGGTTYEDQEFDNSGKDIRKAYKAYTDDYLTLVTKITDENPSACSIEWELEKRGADGIYRNRSPENVLYIKKGTVISKLNINGGQIRINENGFYRLTGTISDELGGTAKVTIDIRIYNPPVAVLQAHNQDYVPNMWVTKELIEFNISSDNSIVDDEWGKGWHAVDFTKDNWDIVPLNGQKLSSIYVMGTTYTTAYSGNTANGMFSGRNSALGRIMSGVWTVDRYWRALSFTEAGQYRIDYWCTNDYGKVSQKSSYIIYVDPKEAPLIAVEVPSVIYRDPSPIEGIKSNTATITMTGNSVNNNKMSDITIKAYWAADNNGDFNSEKSKQYTWSVGMGNANAPNISGTPWISSKVEESKDPFGVLDKEGYSATFLVNKLGKYMFEVTAFETPSHRVIPVILSRYSEFFQKITEKCYTEVDNVAPGAQYKSNQVAKADIVFAIGDYSQSGLLLASSKSFQSMINAGSNLIDARVEEVTTVSIDMSEYGAEEIFNTWRKMPASNGDGQKVWELDRANGRIYSEGVRGRIGGHRSTAIINSTPEGFETGDFEISFTYDASRYALCNRTNGGNVNARGWSNNVSGVLFRYQEAANGTYTTYALIMSDCAQGYYLPLTGIPYVALIKVRNGDADFLPGTYCNSLFVPWAAGIDKTDGSLATALIQRTHNAPDKLVGQWAIGEAGGRSESMLLQARALPTNMSKDITLIVEGNHFQVKVGDKVELDVTDTYGTPYSTGTYGFFSFSSPNVYFSHVKIDQNTKSNLGKAIQDVAWRDGSARFIIHATDVVPDDFQNFNSIDYSYTLTKMLDSNAYLINLGNSINMSALNKLIADLREPNGTAKGISFNNSNVNTALRSSADYIIDILKGLEKPSDYILVNTEMKWETEYWKPDTFDPAFNQGMPDELDPSLKNKIPTNQSGQQMNFNSINGNFSKIFAERWRYSHNASFYDNGGLKEAFDAVWIQDPINFFKYPGLHRVNYKRRDNPLENANLNDPFNNYRYWSTIYDPKIPIIEPSSLSELTLNQFSLNNDTTLNNKPSLTSFYDNSILQNIRQSKASVLQLETPSIVLEADSVNGGLKYSIGTVDYASSYLINIYMKNTVTGVYDLVKTISPALAAPNSEIPLEDGIIIFGETYTADVMALGLNDDYLDSELSDMTSDVVASDYPDMNTYIPVITAVWNETTNKITLTIEPNGNTQYWLTINGETKAPRDFPKDVDGKPTADTYIINNADTTKPSIPTNVQYRMSGQNMIIDWGEALDQLQDYYFEIQGNVKNGDPVSLLVSSSECTYEVYCGGVLVKALNSSARTLTIAKKDLKLGDVSIIAIDKAGNKSDHKVVTSINSSDLYKPTMGSYSGETNENIRVFIEIAYKDTHDSAWAVPEIDRVEINPMYGDVTLLKPGHNQPSLADGYYVEYTPAKDYYGDVEIKYYYKQVRSDIPAASATVKVTVIHITKPPVTKDIGRNITDVLNASDNTTILMPVNMILDTVQLDFALNRTKLKISQLQVVSGGAVSLEGNSIKIVPADDYSGVFEFAYKVHDGVLESLDWAYVQVYITKQYRPLTATDVSATQELSTHFRVYNVLANVDGGNKENRIIRSPLGTPTINGMTAAEAVSVGIVYTDTDGKLTAKIEVTWRNTARLSVGDVVVIPFTVTDGASESSAYLRITITKGDDPLNMEGYLYVHRKPIALVTPAITKSGNIITRATINTSNERSYDLDHNDTHITSNPQRPSYSWKGVRTWEWAVRYTTGSWITGTFDASAYNDKAEDARVAGINWVNTELNKLFANRPGADVMLSFRVRDIDGPSEIGIWSDANVILFTSNDVKPIARFTMNSALYMLTRPVLSNTMIITDSSYDPAGNPLTAWEWKLTLPDGTVLTYAYSNTDTLQREILQAVYNTVYSAGYGQHGSQFKLTLVVSKTHANKEFQKSDPYSVTFTVYRENEPPEITFPPTSQVATLASSTLYEEDLAQDGVKGDNWGTSTNTTYKGMIDFTNILKITSIHPLNTLKVSWMFEGQDILKRLDYNDMLGGITVKSYPNLLPGQSPFNRTVTAEGLTPGAYKIGVAVKDDPDPLIYGTGAGSTTLWETQKDRSPYHLYVVPRLDMWVEMYFGGWKWNANETSTNPTRVLDGKTLSQVATTEGILLDDIVPTIGDTIKYVVETNKYVTNMEAYIDYNKNGVFDANDISLSIPAHTVLINGKHQYTFEYLIDDIADAPEGVDFTDLTLVVTGGTIYGSEYGNGNMRMQDGTWVMRQKTRSMTIPVLPVKLFDFRVSYVTDPTISSKFATEINKYAVKDGNALLKPYLGIPVPNLAVDTNSVGGVNGIEAMRKGYSFYFEVGSKGMKKDTDELVITPYFFEQKVDAMGNVTIGRQLEGYLPDKFGKYLKYTDGSNADINSYYPLYYEGDRINNIGTHFRINIKPNNTLRKDISTSEQLWRGRYGIPADAKFFPTGTAVLTAENEYKGNILIVFQIEAYKKGSSRYDYIKRGQWEKERTNATDIINLLYNGGKINTNSSKGAYANKETEWQSSIFAGAVIVYDGSKSVRDEYQVNPVWKD